MPIVFGTASVSGTFIYCGPLLTSTAEEGGKGGPEQKTYNYNQTVAVGLCESVIDLDNAINLLTRVWENGALVFDIRPQLVANTQTGVIAETDDEYTNRLQVSANYQTTFTLYIGSETQLPDPSLEAIEGVGNVGAFRGLAYVVYPNRMLTIAQGLRHPNFQFEVTTSGIGSCVSEPMCSNEVLYPWNQPDAPDPRPDGNTYMYANTHTGIKYPTVAQALAGIYHSDGTTLRVFDEEKITCWVVTPTESIPVYSPTNPRWVAQDVIGGALFFNNFAAAYNYEICDGTSAADVCAFASGFVPGTWWNGQWNLDPSHRYGEDQIGAGIYRLAPLSDVNYHNSETASFNCPDETNVLIWSADEAIGIVRSPASPRDPCYGLPMSSTPGYAVDIYGNLVQCNSWVYDNTHTYNVLTTFSDDIYAPITQYPRNPCLLSTDPRNTEEFWTDAYNSAVTLGLAVPGKTYAAPGTGSTSNYPQQQGFAYTINNVVCQGIGAQVTVAEIISKICQRAGLTSVDVSDMETVFVDGYQISSLCSGASIIQPLRSIAYFDAIESGDQLRFQSRGKAIVATLTTDDVGAYDVSSGGATPPPSIKVARTMDTELPRQIRVHYIATQRDYQDGEQDSEFRLTTTAVNDTDVSLPFALHDTVALNAANILWATQWAQRNTYTFALDQSWSALEDGDAVAIPVEGFYKRVLLTQDTNASGVLRTFTAVDDDSASYISEAIAPPNNFRPPIIPSIYATKIELLDIPALQDADNNAGFYIAAQRDTSSSGNTWSGCTIYKSIDGGATFTSQFSLTQEATLGNLYVALEASEYFDWDDSSQIIVDVASDAFSFESRTDDAVLSGANLAAMGANGRWELIQFANAEQLSGTQWKLTRLLRGRRGTEYVIGTSQANDTFVLVSTGDINRINLSTSEIGATRIYKAVSIGADYLTGQDSTFAGLADALKCFSPVDAKLERQSDGDLLISWTRRDRLGRTLMSGVDMPLSDIPLSFSIDIISHASSPRTVLRTLSSTTTSVIYSAADQVADFGSSDVLDLAVAIYQLSPTIGRGTPLVAVIEVST